MKKRKRTATMPFTTGRTRKPAPPRHDLMLPSNDQPEENRRTKKRQSLTESEEEHEDEDNIPSMPVREDSRELTEILYEGYKQNKPKGWRPASLFVGDRQDRATWEFHYTQDLETLKNHRTNHGRMTREVHNPKHISGIPNAYSAAYLNWSWGVGEAYHRYLAFQKRRRYSRAASGEPARRRKTISTKIKSNPARNGDNQSASNRMCVITNREAAQKRFNARAMFISFRVQQLAELESNGIRKQDLPARPPKGHMHSQQSPLLNVSNRTREWMEEAREDYEKLSNEDIEYWRDQERKHDERQPEIITILQAALAKDPRRSAKKLMEDIGYWCGKTTIGKWKNMNKGTFHRRRDVPNAFVDAEEEDADEEEEDPTEEDEGDNDNGDDDDDDGSEEFEDEGDEEGEESPVGEEDLEKENLVNGRSKERRPPVREEKRQFLAKIPGASVNRKKDVDDSTQLPVRISVSTDKYIDTHVSALVCSPETNLTMNIAEEPTEEPTVCDEEHLVI